MISSRKNNRNNLEKLNLERKVDQFIEVSRQFVDGVSGKRPGRRKSSSLKELSKRKVDNVTQWVTKTVDSLFEDEDEDEDEYEDWYYQNDEQQKDMNKTFERDKNFSQDIYNSDKKPLTAVSLREVYNQPKKLKSSNEVWPDDAEFQLNRWKRSSLKPELSNPNTRNSSKNNIKLRNLPKSSRRRI